MAKVTHCPYTKTAIMSIMFHVVFFSIALVAGEYNTSYPSVEPPPIEVEIEPSRLLNMGSGKLNLTSGSPPPGPKKSAKPQTKTVAKPEPLKEDVPQTASVSSPVLPESYPPAMTGEDNETSVALPNFGARESDSGDSGDGGDGAHGTGRGGPGGGGGTIGDGEGGGDGYTSSGYRSGSLPSYPRAARREGREGVVTVRVLVGVDGVPETVTVRETSGYEDFDEVAVKAVKKWRFSPAKRGGKPVANFHDVKVRFRLDKTD
jgi:protein TonB